MKQLSAFQDADGFIGHVGGDGKLEFGDGALRLGQAAISGAIKNPLDKFYLLFSGPEPVRYPDASMWYGQPGTMSRDNLLGLISAANVLGYTTFLDVVLRALLKRFFFAWNTKPIWPGPGDPDWKIPDWCGPGTLRLLLHGSSYSVRLLLDGFTILDSIARVLSSVFFPSHTSADQVFVLGILARRKTPTLFSKLAEKIYMTGVDYKSALTSYFSSETSPPLDVYLIAALNQDG